MEVVAHEERQEFTLPGIAHRTLAGGLEGTDVWLQTMEPGAETPPHYHECGEAVVLLSGQGTAIGKGMKQVVGARETVTFEAGEVHQLVNSGEEPIRLLAVLNEPTPARAFSPDGEELELPWQEVR